MQASPHIILGIDPGYDRLGWSVATSHSQPLQILGYGCIVTDKKADMMSRYTQIITELHQILSQYHPTVAAIESLFFSKNQTTAMRVAEVRGVIIAQLLAHQLQIHEYNPMQIKLVAAGHGQADKTAVAKMVKLQVKWPTAQEPTSKTLDDALDAVAMCLTDSVLSKQRV